MNDESGLKASRDERLRESLLLTFLGEEEQLWNAQNAFENARYALEVAKRKYSAVRDMVAKELGESPYDSALASTFLTQHARTYFPTQGTFRFYGMAPGDAALAALTQAAHPLTFQELIDRLRSGGIEVEESSLGRAINAALIHRRGVQKTADGRYFTRKETESTAEPADTEAQPYIRRPRSLNLD